MNCSQKNIKRAVFAACLAGLILSWRLLFSLLLVLAVRQDCYGLTRLSLFLGANPNARIKVNDKELGFKSGPVLNYVACKGTSPAILEELIAYGADVSDRDEDYRTPIMCVTASVKDGKADAAESWPPAAYSTKNPRWRGRFLKILIEAGAPFSTAHSVQSWELVEVMIRSRDVELVKMTLPLMYGICVNPWRVEDAPAAQPPIHIAAETENVDMIRYLAQYGFDVNEKDENQRTALFLVVDKDGIRLHVLKCLLELGADPNTKDVDGKTVLFSPRWNRIPAYSVRRKALDLLLAQGTDVNIQDNEGKTVLMEWMHSATADDVTAPLYLIEHGANLELRDHQGKTALDYTDSEELRKKCLECWEAVKRSK